MGPLYKSQMKCFLLIIACFFSFHNESKADIAYTYSGNPSNPSFLQFDSPRPDSCYQSILLQYLSEYATALANEAHSCYGFIHKDLKGKSMSEAKTIIMERIINHPEEVNDITIGGESSGTPLTIATQICDYDIVSLLIKYGAIPYSPNGMEFSDGYFQYGGVSQKTTQEDIERISNLIKDAQKKWPQVKNPRFFNTLRSPFYQTNRRQ